MNFKIIDYKKRKSYAASPFAAKIKQIERRLIIQSVLENLPAGLILAESAGIAFIMIAVLTNSRFSISTAAFIALTAVIGVIAALISAWSGGQSASAAAESIDSAYGLDDRFLTSQSILSNTDERSRSLAERVQLDDCLTFVPQVKPKEVVAYRCPRSLFYAVLPLAVLLTILGATLPNVTLAVDKTPNETVVDAIKILKTEIQEPLREMVRENPENDEVKQLDLQVTQFIHSLEEVRDDPKKGLAIISGMERRIKETVEAFQIEAADRSFQEIAGALSQCEVTRTAADALLSEDYDKAANELEKIDFDKIDARERQKLAQRLENVAKTIRSRRQEQLAQLTEQLSEELLNSKCASCKNTACKLAGKCKGQKLNKSTAQKLNCQLARLGLCKSNCAGACASCEMNCSDKSGTARKSASQGNPDASTAGKEAASNPLTGTPTSLKTERELHQIDGVSNGEGASEIAVTKTEVHSAEKIKTSYRDEEHTFQQERENAIRNEEIPFERREVIRNYFESIRPSGSAHNGENR